MQLVGAGFLQLQHLLLFGALVAGCGSGGERTCLVDADCASGACRPDGTCAPVSTADTDPSDTGEADLGTAQPDVVTTEPDVGTGEPDAGGPGGCAANRDGTITAAELPFAAGRTATYRLTTPAPGYDSACGEPCVWELEGNGEDVEVTLESLEGAWFQADFPGATYVAESGALRAGLCEQLLVGIYRADAAGLWLLGQASEDESGGTLLVFDPPIPILEYPLQIGASWTVSTVAEGSVCGFEGYAIQQTWTSAVDASGTARTPYGDFDGALRVNTLIERHGSLLPVVTPSSARVHTFLAECFTAIASARSEEHVETAEFEGAAQLQSLSVTP